MTKQMKVGGIKIGGGAPIVIQSMTKTDTRDIAATVKQIKELEKAGCEIVRVAVKDLEAAKAIRGIKKKIHIPLAADIHFDYKLAISAIESGADKVRLNPGNIYNAEDVREVVKMAKKRRVPIRVGVNSGSIRSQVTGNRSQVTGQRLQVESMVKSAFEYIKVLEEMDFYDIIVSLKSSDVLTSIEAYRLFARRSKYPLHLGVTAAGPIETGLVKSSIGIGALLLEGIGDTIRISLTGNPCAEVIAAKNILQALKLRHFGPEIISCPTCGRCQVDLQEIVRKIELGIRLQVAGSRSQVAGSKIAIMGCEVNGPGEAKEADIGIACGKNAGVIFKKGRVIKRVKEDRIVKELMKIISC